MADASDRQPALDMTPSGPPDSDTCAATRGARARKPPHLRALESEAIGILRETRAQCRSPALLYSIGKDSSVLLHLALKAFGGRLPFPALHIDTGWKFREMIRFRDETAARLGLDLRVHSNADPAARAVDPLSSAPGLYTRLMKTEALRQALDQGGFDAAIGGARRDEERSRAKERVFSRRDARHGWDPRRQRPELWTLYDARVRPGESVRVFPLSNWTERDVWAYILAERISVVDLYFARERPVVERDGRLIVRDDQRLVLRQDETIRLRRVRFRTLGCYPLTGAIESAAGNVREILDELAASPVSERGGRLIDHDEPAAMERKKREGYF